MSCPQEAGHIWKMEDSTGICAQTQTGWVDWEYPNNNAQESLGFYLDTWASSGYIGPATTASGTCGILSSGAWKDTTSVAAFMSTGSITIYYLGSL